MSKTVDVNDSRNDLADKYEGVSVCSFHYDSVRSKLQPSGYSKLKEHYHKLPNYKEDGRLEKVGLTKDGYVAYRNTITDRMVYYNIQLRPKGIYAVKPRGRSRDSNEPHSGFGTEWYITP